MIGDGPNITSQAMLDYLNDRLDYDPATQQWLDQLFAASNELRQATGAVSGVDAQDSRILSDRARALHNAMWNRLRAESDDARCKHLHHRELQPTVIVPKDQRQMCAECWHAYDWSPLPNKLTRSEARVIACDCCGERPFRARWDDDNGDGGIRIGTFTHWYFAAPLTLCRSCWDTLRHSRETVQTIMPDDPNQTGDAK